MGTNWAIYTFQSHMIFATVGNSDIVGYSDIVGVSVYVQ
jgi:hypothetical protein